ncbi:hypothetical protein SDC9_83365 [bioreactor metagenome]|uniref:Methyltransferase type 11 domain-containing protein n=1 Tax=bioreactor metagenome TaxID=1076179 RepID=A0A644ZDI2_9ZZZZ|nr:methyltransferase type 11 [Candidatus Metalachnospira sp.]
MSNPWNDISLEDYENHMKLDSVYQLQTISKMMKEQVYTYPVEEIMVLGIAGGNGLEHVDEDKIKRVYGVDVNSEYLEKCVERFPQLKDVFVPVCADFVDKNFDFPSSEMVIANLFVEYVGVDCFTERVSEINPKYISVIIQIDESETFVSDSPYIKSFDVLESIHCQIDRNELIKALEKMKYTQIFEKNEILPNRKRLIRLDFKGNN